MRCVYQEKCLGKGFKAVFKEIRHASFSTKKFVFIDFF